VSLGVGGAARPLNGDRGVGGKCPKAGVPSPGTGDPIVAGVAGVRIPPVLAALPGANKPGESPSPAGVPGKPPVPVEGVRPVCGGGAEAGEYGE
jgi:hypothetical protein